MKSSNQQGFLTIMDTKEWKHVVGQLHFGTVEKLQNITLAFKKQDKELFRCKIPPDQALKLDQSALVFETDSTSKDFMKIIILLEMIKLQRNQRQA
ncbi:UNKNOWN [Stylonychia lemnae]|uniref:Uncharacterized protein n=1 Tax=Stylonychia lemnae TaxID=5949 RepID=A0A078B513_STYLE|nr:UNKNOWN [Stylonychia lemnae]|eukprot:CDW88327.1 UNKNOWN [Stylonychia lemnae]